MMVNPNLKSCLVQCLGMQHWIRTEAYSKFSIRSYPDLDLICLAVLVPFSLHLLFEISFVLSAFKKIVLLGSFQTFQLNQLPFSFYFFAVRCHDVCTYTFPPL